MRSSASVRVSDCLRGTCRPPWVIRRCTCGKVTNSLVAGGGPGVAWGWVGGWRWNSAVPPGLIRPSRLFPAPKALGYYQPPLRGLFSCRCLPRRLAELAEKLAAPTKSLPQALKRGPIFSDISARVELVPFPIPLEPAAFCRRSAAEPTQIRIPADLNPGDARLVGRFGSSLFFLGKSFGY
jgi:hypothetical protein